MNATLAHRPPKGTAWRHVGPYPGPNVLSAAIYRRGAVCVISALEMAKLPRRDEPGPQWHVSISRAGHRPRRQDVELALIAFGLVGAEEDNHHPGNARHFWMPVDPQFRVGCECAEEERVVVDSDGYTWTTPHDGECRGCEFEALTGRPCPLHGEARHG
jgi:hypothetical protein